MKVHLESAVAKHHFAWMTAGTWCACGWGGVHMRHADYDEHLVEALMAELGFCPNHDEPMPCLTGGEGL